MKSVVCGLLIAALVLAAMTDDDVKNYLRAKPVEDIFAAYPRVLGGMMALPTLFADGEVIHEEGVQSFVSGNYPNKVPVILASTADEVRGFASQEFLGSPLLPHIARYGSQLWTAVNIEDLARQMTVHSDQPDVFVYLFNWGAYSEDGTSQIEAPMDQYVGAGHGLDIPFVLAKEDPTYFGSVKEQIFTQGNKEGRDALTAVMSAYAASFAKAGNPNNAVLDLPLWTVWSPVNGDDKFIFFDSQGGQAVAEMRNTELTRDGILQEMDMLLDTETYDAVIDAMLDFSMTCTLLVIDTDQSTSICE